MGNHADDLPKPQRPPAVADLYRELDRFASRTRGIGARPRATETRKRATNERAGRSSARAGSPSPPDLGRPCRSQYALGAHAVALIALLKKCLGPSHGNSAALPREWFGLRVRSSSVTSLHVTCSSTCSERLSRTSARRPQQCTNQAANQLPSRVNRPALYCAVTLMIAEVEVFPAPSYALA